MRLCINMIDCICEVIREKQINILDFWNLAFNYSFKTQTLGKTDIKNGQLLVAHIIINFFERFVIPISKKTILQVHVASVYAVWSSRIV